MKQIMKNYIWVSYGVSCVSKRICVGLVQVLDALDRKRYAASCNSGPIAALTAKVSMRHARKYPPYEYVTLSEILGGVSTPEEE